jgi:hypothetical protein
LIEKRIAQFFSTAVLSELVEIAATTEQLYSGVVVQN